MCSLVDAHESFRSGVEYEVRRDLTKPQHVPSDRNTNTQYGYFVVTNDKDLQVHDVEVYARDGIPLHGHKIPLAS